MKGTRVYLKEGETIPKLKPGDYGQDIRNNWWCKVPNGEFRAGCMLTGHDKAWNVTEHEDGTITVSPSIGIGNVNGKWLYHGYLEKGIWREV